MRILFISNLYHPEIIGGAEIHCQMIAERLVENAHDVYVLTTGKPSGKKRKTDEINGVKILINPERNIYWNKDAKKQKPIFKMIWHLIDIYNPISMIDIFYYLKKIKPDIICTFNVAGFSCSVWSACYMKHLPIVHVVNDFYLICYKSELYKNRKICTKQCIACRGVTKVRRSVSKKLTMVVSVSQTLLDVHIQNRCFGGNVQYKIAPNLIENRTTTVIPKYEVPVFGYIGRLDYKKGIETLLEAMKNSEYSLLVYGTGESNYRTYLEKKYSEVNIDFKGFSDHKTIFESISVLVIPSLWQEPFGRGVIEANAYGIPVIASRIGGLEENVKDGENGYLFTPGDCEDLKIKMHIMASTIKDFEKRRSFLVESTLKKYSDDAFNTYLKIFEKIYTGNYYND